MNEARIWLVYSREHEAWWRPASAGYTMSIAEAGRYTKTDAARHCTSVDRMPDGQTKEFAHLAPEVEEQVLALPGLFTACVPFANAPDYGTLPDNAVVLRGNIERLFLTAGQVRAIKAAMARVEEAG